MVKNFSSPENQLNLRTKKENSANSFLEWPEQLEATSPIRGIIYHSKHPNQTEKQSSPEKKRPPLPLKLDSLHRVLDTWCNIDRRFVFTTNEPLGH